MGMVGAVSRPLWWLLLGALFSAAVACSSQLAQGQRPAARIAVAAPQSVPAASSASIAPPDPPAPENTAEATPPAAVVSEPALGIEDPSGQALAAFHAALRRAQAGEGQARIVFYGASHVASDSFTGPVRQQLQHRFGEAGPGFVLLGKPWRWYRHAGISIEESRGLHAIRIKARAPVDGIYGLAGVAFDVQPGKPARSAIVTRQNGGLSGHASRLELYYLRQPGGGRIHLFVDGERMQRIDTHAARSEPAYATFALQDGPHRIELRTSGAGPVRVFGAALERDVPGVILDTLGIPGARARDHLHWDDAIYRAHLGKRRPDLIVLAYGTNESGDDDVPIDAYAARVTRVLRRVREITPQASCLLIGPSDRPLRIDDGSFVDRPLTTAIVAEQRRLAREFGCGFFDVQRFMGGPLAMLQWVSAVPPLGTADHVHFTQLGYDRLAGALHAGLLAGFDAGLPAPDAPPEPPGAVATTPQDTSAAAQELPRAVR